MTQCSDNVAIFHSIPLVPSERKLKWNYRNVKWFFFPLQPSEMSRVWSGMVTDKLAMLVYVES